MNALDWRLSILVAAVFVSSAAYPQAKPPAAKPTSAPVSTGFTTVVANRSATALPKGYRGHDAKAIIKDILTSKALAPRKEFETTEQYDQRLASYRLSIGASHVNLDSPLCFVVPSGSRAVELDYNADEQTLHVEITVPGNTFVLDDQATMWELELQSTQILSRKYVASNAFGAKVQVTEEIYETYGVAVNTDAWPFGKGGTYKTDVEMRIAFAKAHKASLRLALVGHLASTKIRRDPMFKDATITDPTKLGDDQRYLEFVPEQVLLFDQASGQLIKRFTEEEELRLAKEKADQYEAEQRKEYPLVAHVSSSTALILHVSSDDNPEVEIVVGPKGNKLLAKKTLALRCISDKHVEHLKIEVSGKEVQQNWESTGVTVGPLREGKMTVRVE